MKIFEINFFFCDKNIILIAFKKWADFKKVAVPVIFWKIESKSEDNFMAIISNRIEKNNNNNMEVVSMRAIFTFLQFRWIFDSKVFWAQRDGRRKRILKIVNRIPLEI